MGCHDKHDVHHSSVGSIFFNYAWWLQQEHKISDTALRKIDTNNSKARKRLNVDSHITC